MQTAGKTQNAGCWLTLVEIAIGCFVKIRFASPASALSLEMFLEVGYPAPKRFDLFIQTGETIGKNLVEIAARRCFLPSPAGTFA